MNKKYFIAICLFVLLSIVSLLSAFYHLQKKSLQNVLGSYTFAVTKTNLHNLSRISLTTTDGNELNFYYDSGIWLFEEAADYFTNDAMMNNFYNIIQNSVLTEKIDNKIPKSNQINIKTFSANGKILNDVYLAADDYSIMHYADNDTTYKITHTENFSVEPEDWLPMPLLEISTDLISAINFNGKYAERKTLDETKSFSENHQYFYKTLGKIDYEGIMTDELFKNEYLPLKSKELKIYLHGGLNYRLQLFTDAENYYLQIIPERELIARTEVNSIIALKELYYLLRCGQ